MSSAVVRAHIAAILTDEEFSLECPRMKLAKETASHVLELASSSSATFDTFATSLVEKLQPTCKTFGTRARRNMWSKFHSVRSSDLAVLWTEFFSNLGVKEEYTIDPLFQQYINENVFRSILASKLSLEHTVVESAELTLDELNILR